MTTTHVCDQCGLHTPSVKGQMPLAAYMKDIPPASSSGAWAFALSQSLCQARSSHEHLPTSPGSGYMASPGQ